MNLRTRRTAVVGAVVAVLLFLVGGVLLMTFGPSAGEMRTESRSVRLGAADSVRATIQMHSGVLTVSGGAADLLGATFRYNVDAWRPHVDYSVADGQGHLVVRQASEDIGLVRGARTD